MTKPGSDDDAIKAFIAARGVKKIPAGKARAPDMSPRAQAARRIARLHAILDAAARDGIGIGD